MSLDFCLIKEKGEQKTSLKIQKFGEEFSSLVKRVEFHNYEQDNLWEACVFPRAK